MYDFSIDQCSFVFFNIFIFFKYGTYLDPNQCFDYGYGSRKPSNTYGSLSTVQVVRQTAVLTYKLLCRLPVLLARKCGERGEVFPHPGSQLCFQR